MNKFLANALSSVNAFIAVVIIFVPGIAAVVTAGTPQSFILGCLVGGILAILICGSLALLINIKDELVLANQSLNDLKVAEINEEGSKVEGSDSDEEIVDEKIELKSSERLLNWLNNPILPKKKSRKNEGE